MPTKLTKPHDIRQLRITLFPEHPQTILIYVPDGQSLRLPALPTPFDIDTVCDILDDHGIPHDAKEGDRNRWWRNLKQSENEDKSVQGIRQREAEAARHVQIHLSPVATTFEKQRSEVFLMKCKAEDELRQLKAEASRARANAATRRVYEPADVYHQRARRIVDLQTTVIALQKKLGDLKAQQHRERKVANREELFVQKAKRHLTREQFLAIWKEIDEEVMHENVSPP
jgi:hypothetical protein